MTGVRPLVFLFRADDEADPYEKMLEDGGFRARSIPVLRINLINERDLRLKLEHPRSYDGIIVTSPRAVDALSQAMTWLPSENVLWHTKPVYGVGPRTAENLRSIGFEPVGEECGTAETLAAFIADGEFTRPLLFLSGDRRRDTLLEALSTANIAVEELCVYETRSRTNLELPASEHPDWAVFFSPSGIEAVEAGGSLDLHQIGIAAIGPTTADALRMKGYHVRAVADRPTPESLLEALQSAG